jgi:membrane-bound ClpP family serine protease
MKKSQLLTAMGLLTITGIAIVAAGLLSLSQQPSYTFAQAWSELWDQHTLFAWVLTIYCSMMLAFDLWVVIGILSQAPEKTTA